MASYQLSGDNAVDTKASSLWTHFMFQESVRGRNWRGKRGLHHQSLKINWFFHKLRKMKHTQNQRNQHLRAWLKSVSHFSKGITRRTILLWQLFNNLLIILRVLPCTLIFISSSSSFFSFFFLNQAKFTLTFNHHGLTLHPTTVDVSKLKTFQLQQKILKP